MRKFISLSTEIFLLPHGGKFSFTRRLDFLPQENLFPCGRKNIFLRKEIFFCAEGNFVPCGRGKFFMRTEENFYAHKKIFSCAQNFFFVRTKI